MEHVCARRHAECRRVRADLSHGAASADRYGRMERCGGLDRYVGEYAGEAKKRLRQAANSADLVTFMRNQAVSPENLLRLLQNGAHAYTSTGNKEQALAMSILIGEMLSISHGRP